MQFNTEFKVNPLCQDLTTSKHNLAEGRTPEEVGVASVRLSLVLVNLRVVKERQMFVGLQNNGFI